jgi:hypothetical protein
MTYMRFSTVSSHLTLGVLVERAFNALKRGKAVVLSDHEAARSLPRADAQPGQFGAVTR